MRAHPDRWLLLLLLCGPAGCSERESTLWETSRCTATPPTLTGGDGANWSRCRFWYSPGSGTIASSVSIQLVSPGTTGSFALPGPGWLSVLIWDFDNVEGPVAIAASPGALNSPIAEVSYRSHSGITTKFARGTITVLESSIDAYGAPESDAFRFQAAISAESANGAMRLSGRIGLNSPPVTSGGGGSGGGGGGGGSCSASSCSALQSRCNGGPVQAPCYCAAACLCRCAGNAQCEAQNLSVARQLGTTNCGY